MGSLSPSFYGLSEIPFEPTGAAVGKYPFVAPNNFSILEEKLAEATMNMKLYVILLNSPQGGGKSATIHELTSRIQKGAYSFTPCIVISHKLFNLNIKNYVTDVFTTLANYDIHPESELSDQTPNQLEIELVRGIKNLALKGFLLTWIIDEFDILVDRPEEEQRNFLQFLRTVVDDLASETLPIVFIMSHTFQSSIEFQRHLRDMHGPFRDRITDSIDLGYTIDEVKNIVKGRLDSVRVDALSDLENYPFQEEAIQILYDLILATGQSSILTNFRLFERCCYNAIYEGIKLQLSVIGPTHVINMFQTHGLPRDKPSEPTGLSIKARTHIATKKRSPHIVQYQSIFNGIVKGLNLLEGFEVKTSYTDYRGLINENFHCGVLDVGIIHELSDRLSREVKLLWILITKSSDLLISSDVNGINEYVNLIKEDLNLFSNVFLVCYVSEMAVDHSLFRGTENIIHLSPKTRDDLIGLDANVQEDVRELRKSFDAEIALVLRDIINSKTFDINYRVPSPVLRLVKALNVRYFANEVCSDNSILEFEKMLFGSKQKTRASYVKEMIRLGLAKRDGMSIIPATPNSISHILKYVKYMSQNKDDLSSLYGDIFEEIQKFGYEVGLFQENEDLILNDVESIRLKINNDYDHIENALKQRAFSSRPVGKLSSTVIKSITNVELHGEHLNKIIVYSTFSEISDRIKTAIQTAKNIGVIQSDPLQSALPSPQTSELPSVGLLDELETGATRSSDPITTSRTPPVQSGDLPSIIIEILSDNSLLLREIQEKIVQKGLPRDKVSQTVISLILTQKLRVTKVQ